MISFKSRLALPFFVALFCGISFISSAYIPLSPIPNDLIASQSHWVDSKLANMSIDEKIGQLMMVAAYSSKDQAHENELKQLIRDHHIGGLIFFKGEPVKQLRQTNTYQSLSKTPLLIAIDGEWGLNMRLKNTVKYPRQLMLGAIQDNSLIEEMGKQVAQQCKRMGIHINFAPVIDVNNNANNPVINDRSFGEDKYSVAAKGIAYMKGMQDNGILACGKHFPGHGDTDVDSHFDLPVIMHDRARLEEVEFYPFKELINNGLESMMIAHLSIPSLDPTPNQASTLSKPIVTDLLRNEMGFNGLIFTDALNMEGVTKYYKPGEVEVKAFLAGNDVLLFPTDVSTAVSVMKEAVSNGSIQAYELDNSVKRILKAKYKVGLNNYKPAVEERLVEELNQVSNDLLNRQMAEKAITLVENKNNLIPFLDLETKRIASINIGGNAHNIFQRTLNFYAPVDHYYLSKTASETDIGNLLNALQSYTHVIITLHDLSRHANRAYGTTVQMIDAVNRINQLKESILVVHGSPYTLSKFPGQSTLVCSYEDNPLNQQITAQMLFGAIAMEGALPVSASDEYFAGKSVKTGGGLRLKYTVPEEVGLSRFDFVKIDEIAEEAISTRATPGCVILMAKDGKVIFYKSYGYHTYSKKEKVSPNDLYDLASLTKVAATNLSIMNLYDKGVIDINQGIGNYLSRAKGTNKESITIKNMLLHEAGLVSWIPFYAKTVDENKTPDGNYSKSLTPKFNLEVADGMYMNKDYVGEMWDTILTSELKNKGRYKYSDVGFYMFKEAVEEQTGTSLATYAENNFYKPLGLSTMTYNPNKKFRKNRIVPTEKDDYFRHQLVHGHVHDMGAAMLGGVSGHAGLFSNANDIAIIFQMLLNKGSYGGKSFFNPSTVDLFTSIQKENNRRGLGFDKPNLDNWDKGPCCEDATPATFGHTGFTGIGAWADPKHNVIYVFLSNRVHPKMNNTKLIKNDFRPRIQQVLYDAMEKSGIQ